MKDKIKEYLSAPIAEIIAFKPQFVTKKRGRHHKLSDCSAEIQEKIRRRRHALDSENFQVETQQETDTESGETRSEGREQNPEGNGK